MGKKRGASAAGAMPAAAPPDHVPVGKQTASNKQDSTGSVMAERAQKPIDPRFAAMQTDPRFERFPDKRRIIKFDPRFAGALEAAAVRFYRKISPVILFLLPFGAACLQPPSTILTSTHMPAWISVAAR